VKAATAVLLKDVCRLIEQARDATAREQPAGMRFPLGGANVSDSER